MSKKQLTLLCLSYMILIAVGSGITSLLPVYVVRLGASRTITGLLLSVAFSSLAIGTMSAGWLSERIQSRKWLLFAASLAAIPALGLLTQATRIEQVAVLVCVVWFTGGIMAAMIHTLVGLFSGREERGKVFGVLGSANGLAGVISGLTAGPIADRWGYSALFVVATLLYLLLPIIAALMADKVIARAAKSAEKVVEQKLLSNRAYLLLFSASTLAFIASGAALLGRPLQMNRLGFDSTAITSAVAVGNLFSLPLPFLIGWLSDRIPRKYLLAACYLATMLGMATLAVASEVWHFWLCAMFMNIAAISLTVGAALVTDFVPTRLLSRGMSSFTATNWIGITIGFVATGAALDRLGVPLVMMIGAALAVVAFVLVSSLRTPTTHRETILTTADE